MARIRILIDEAEWERFRRQAEREGKSRAAWLRVTAWPRPSHRGSCERWRSSAASSPLVRHGRPVANQTGTSTAA